MKGKKKHFKAVFLLIFYNVCFQLGMCHAISTLLPIFLSCHPHLIILFNPPPLVIERYRCKLLAMSLILLKKKKLARFAAVVNAPNDKASSMRILVLNLYTNKCLREYSAKLAVFSFSDFSLRAEIILMILIFIKIFLTNKWASSYYNLYKKGVFPSPKNSKLNSHEIRRLNFPQKFQPNLETR